MSEPTDASDQLTDALAERDRILVAMDVDAAKAFIAKHGGVVPRRSLDWTKVLHLARFETRTMPEDLFWESRIYLAQNGAQSIATLPPTSPYLRAALDLIFPRDLITADMRAEGIG